VPLPEPVLSEPEPVEVDPGLPLVVEPVDPVLPEDWAKANGAAPSIPRRTIFFMNPFIGVSLQKGGPVWVGPPEVPERVGRDAGRHH
jgi:hypothetical protein